MSSIVTVESRLRTRVRSPLGSLLQLATAYAGLACSATVGGSYHEQYGTIATSPDGSLLASSSQGSLVIDRFDSGTGVPSLLLPPMQGDYFSDVCFSPDGQILYVTTMAKPNDTGNYSTNLYGLKQYRIATREWRTITQDQPYADHASALRLGPDDKLYIARYAPNSRFYSCINFPNRFNETNSNECGYNPFSVDLGGNVGDGGLPNTRCFQPSIQPPKFTYTITNCHTVNFHAVNCSGPYSWIFGDGATGSGQDVSHVYANGPHNVTLTVVGANPASQTVKITIGISPFGIAGQTSACRSPSNYSVNAVPGLNYTWSIMGGGPALWSGPDVNVNWNSTMGGFVTVTASDPVTGCTETSVLRVGTCNACMEPPSGMRAWWPLDEASGNVAQELVSSNDGQHVACVAVPGKVSKARMYPLGSGYTRVKDDPRLDFGSGDLTIDAWIKYSDPLGGTTSPTVSIVDKRSLASPEQGYALFLKNRYLAFRLATGSVGTPREVSLSTPYVLDDGQWHQVAATLQRTPSSGGSATFVRLFVDGAETVDGFGTFTSARNLDNAADLIIAGTAPGNRETRIVDEVELFDRALGANEILALYRAKLDGKCKEFCHVPPVTSMCINDNSETVAIKICNGSTIPHTYIVACQGLGQGTIGCGGVSNWTGPSTFNILTPLPIAVAPGDCGTVTVEIVRPGGMPAGTTSCYQVQATDYETGSVFGACGSLYESFALCPQMSDPNGFHVGLPGPVAFGLRNDGANPIAVAYRVIPAVAEGDSVQPAQVISLNGLPPGTPVDGLLNLAPGGTTTVTVNASFSRHLPFRVCDLLFEAGAPGDSALQILASAGLRTVDEVTTPPHVVDAFPVSTDTLRVVFDRKVTGGAEAVSHYQFGSFTPVLSAKLLTDSMAVDLYAQLNPPWEVHSESVTVDGIIGAASGLVQPEVITLDFLSPALRIEQIQAPDSLALALAPCEDRSAYAGAADAPGPRMTTEGVCTANIGPISYLETYEYGPRTGIACSVSSGPLTVGHAYQWSGSVQEVMGETQCVGDAYVRDLGPSTVPPAIVCTVHTLSDTSCDASQSVLNGEDYEGVLVRVDSVKVVGWVDTNPETPPGGSFIASGSANEASPGGGFLVAAPFRGYSDTLRVAPATGAYAADTAQVLDITGILRFQSGAYFLVPRGDADVQLLGTLGVESDTPRELAFSVYPNPTHGPAAISLALPSATRVDLSIFDVSGRRLARVADGMFKAGRHALSWNGRDSRGNAVRPGMYFYRLRAGTEMRLVRAVKIN